MPRPSVERTVGCVTILPPIALAAALVCLALLEPRLRRWCLKRARSRSRPTFLRYPIVLAHGLFGYDVIERDGEAREYFEGVSEGLRHRGCIVHNCRVAPVATVATRAEAFAAFVRGLPHAKVNVVAHSMGGLDARYAIRKLGLASRVASLTTIGTPHRGTPLADVGVAIARAIGLDQLLERIGVDPAAFDDLTTRRAASFNEAVEDAPGVLYASVVGTVGRKPAANPLLLASWAMILPSAGPNDGIVPASSQRRGEVLAEVDADHLAQVGRSFDASALYDRLVIALRDRGL